MDEKVNITNVEIMKNDMSYMKNDLAEIKATLKIVLEKYVHREEMQSRFDRFQTELDKRMDAVHSRLDKKMDEEDFAPFRKVFWGVVTTVVTSAILGGLYVGTRL